MFSVIKPFEVHKKYEHHHISCRNTILGKGFDVAVGVMRNIPFIGEGNNPPVFTYNIYDIMNPDDFFSYSPHFVGSYMTVLTSDRGYPKLFVSPALLMTLDEVVDKRVKACYDVLKAKQKGDNEYVQI